MLVGTLQLVAQHAATKALYVRDTQKRAQNPVRMPVERAAYTQFNMTEHMVLESREKRSDHKIVIEFFTFS